MVVDRKMDNLNGAVMVVQVNKKGSHKGLVVVD